MIKITLATHAPSIFLGAIVGIIAFFKPVAAWMLILFIVIIADAITGIWASKAEAKRKGISWKCSSEQAIKGHLKKIGYFVAILVVLLVESLMLWAKQVDSIVYAHWVAAFFVGWECWSIVPENINRITDNKIKALVALEALALSFLRKKGRDAGLSDEAMNKVEEKLKE